MAKKPDIKYCGPCEHLAITHRTGILSKVDDHWCLALPGACVEGIEAFGRYPGAWLGFLPVVSADCPKRPQRRD